MRLSTWAVVLLPAVLAAPVRNAESISTMEAESSALQAPDEKPAQTVGGDCVPRESFIPIWFENSTLVRSNLGGMGGRCHIPGACAELLSTDTPHEIYIEDIAVSASGDRVDLRITNQSEYRVWNAYWNGIKDPLKEFGVVHLLGPRQVDQGDSWDTAFTFVQLRFAFINHDSGAPETLSRTYVTFYDFDTGRGRFDGAMASVEMMQMGPEATSFVRAPHTELLNVSGWRSELDDTSYVTAHALSLRSPPPCISGRPLARASITTPAALRMQVRILREALGRPRQPAMEQYAHRREHVWHRQGQPAWLVQRDGVAGGAFGNVPLRQRRHLQRALRHQPLLHDRPQLPLRGLFEAVLAALPAGAIAAIAAAVWHHDHRRGRPARRAGRAAVRSVRRRSARCASLPHCVQR